MSGKILVVGIGADHTPETATKLKHELEEATGVRVIVIAGATGLQVIQHP